MRSLYAKGMLGVATYNPGVPGVTPNGTPMNPQLAARGFFGMFASFILWQEIFGFKKTQPHDRQEVVSTFVSIFLNGITKE